MPQSMEQSLEIDPHKYGQLIFDKDEKAVPNSKISKKKQSFQETV